MTPEAYKLAKRIEVTNQSGNASDFATTGSIRADGNRVRLRIVSDLTFDPVGVANLRVVTRAFGGNRVVGYINTFAPNFELSLEHHGWLVMNAFGIEDGTGLDPHVEIQSFRIIDEV